MFQRIKPKLIQAKARTLRKPRLSVTYEWSVKGHLSYRYLRLNLNAPLLEKAGLKMTRLTGVPAPEALVLLKEFLRELRTALEDGQKFLSAVE